MQKVFEISQFGARDDGTTLNTVAILAAIDACRNVVIANCSFSNLPVRTTGADALVCRHCEGVRLHNVELANHPA